MNLKRLWANGDDAPKAVVVYDGVDLERFQAIARPPIGGPQRVGLIGRISPWKGQDIFLRAAARTIRQFPDARFLVIGSVLFGEESFERDIRRLCDELGINDRVEFTGFQKDVRERLAELDIVVHASTLPEPFGQVIIEAMAAERPVIATKGGGVPEIVVDQVTGLLVPMRDVDRMADAICRLLSDAELRAEMASCGRDRVRQLFTIQQTADNILRVYEGMLSPQLQMRPLADASVGAEIR